MLPLELFSLENLPHSQANSAAHANLRVYPIGSTLCLYPSADLKCKPNLLLFTRNFPMLNAKGFFFVVLVSSDATAIHTSWGGVGALLTSDL